MVNNSSDKDNIINHSSSHSKHKELNQDEEEKSSSVLHDFQVNAKENEAKKIREGNKSGFSHQVYWDTATGQHEIRLD